MSKRPSVSLANAKGSMVTTDAPPQSSVSQPRAASFRAWPGILAPHPIRPPRQAGGPYRKLKASWSGLLIPCAQVCKPVTGGTISGTLECKWCCTLSLGMKVVTCANLGMVV